MGLPTPPATGILVALIIANHGAGGVLGTEPYTVLLFAVTILLSFFMVSTVRFRSFKELKLNTGTVLFVLFTITSSAFVWSRFRPQFVLIWLLSVYILIGVVESVRALLVKLTIVGPDYLTGGAQGPEGSIFCTIFFLIGIAANMRPSVSR
jgi:CDP-diacylglycerol--serine O-phosphatidyltransferase